MRPCVLPLATCAVGGAQLAAVGFGNKIGKVENGLVQLDLVQDNAVECGLKMESAMSFRLSPAILLGALLVVAVVVVEVVNLNS